MLRCSLNETGTKRIAGNYCSWARLHGLRPTVLEFKFFSKLRDAAKLK